MEEGSDKIERSSNKLSRETFKLLLQLNSLQPWLEGRHEALESLLEISQDTKHFDLVVSLVSRFLHIDIKKQNAALKTIADQITNIWGCDPATSFITASNRSDFSDSSENILWLMKPIMSKGGKWSTINFHSRLVVLIEKASEGSNIIVVDEFIGSGTTIEKLVKWIKKKLDERGIKCRIYVCVLVAMQNSKLKLDQSGVEYFAAHWLTRGISDFYQPDDVPAMSAYMQALEDLLAQFR